MEERILSVIRTVLGLEKADTIISHANCEKWDSMRHLNLIVALELEFGVEFEPEEIAEMKSFEIIKKFLEEKID